MYRATEKMLSAIIEAEDTHKKIILSSNDDRERSKAIPAGVYGEVIENSTYDFVVLKEHSDEDVTILTIEILDNKTQDSYDDFIYDVNACDSRHNPDSDTVGDGRYYTN